VEENESSISEAYAEYRSKQETVLCDLKKKQLRCPNLISNTGMLQGKR
jgi:hypothetical protein